MSQSICVYLVLVYSVGYYLALLGQRAESVNPVLDLNGVFPYLINKTDGKVIEPRDYLDFDNIYTPNDTYKRHQTAQGRNYFLLKAFDFANYYQTDHWHYSNEQDLLVSGHPVANAQRCAHQLDWLDRQLNSSDVLFKPGEEHVNLMTLVDAFGRPESNTYLGHGFWFGSYYECLRARIDTQRFELEKCSSQNITNHEECRIVSDATSTGSQDQVIIARYCIGKARDVDWPKYEEDNYVPRISYKIGLCLPESCDTLSFREHKAQIERLMRYNMPPYLKSRFSLNDIYCLPDSRSPIRSLSTSARIFAGFCASWLLLVLLATWFYSYLRRGQQDLKVKQVESSCYDTDQQVVKHELPNSYLLINSNNNNIETSLGKPALLMLNSASSPRGTELVQTSNGTCWDIKKATINKQTNQSSDNYSDSSHRAPESILTAWMARSPRLVGSLEALCIMTNMRNFTRSPPTLCAPDANDKIRINLNVLDFIKCLCCILVILGHVVFVHMQHLTNILKTIEKSHELMPRILISFFNFVDTFFIISGMLTAYFIFKRFNKTTFANPRVWLSIILLRLARLSPVYILTFWFTKTLVVYLSDGPLWDYGTDKNSIRGLCMNDHWWKSLLYIGNLGSLQPLCILPAWSIIIDAQYSLILPPILFLIFKSKRLGYTSMLIATIIATTNMSLQLANQTAVKTSDMSKVRLHVYPLISRFAAEFYNAPWNRIGPVAIGIFAGHMLYLYDLGRIRQWPWFMRGLTFKIVLFLHLFIFILPSLSLFTDPPESTQQADVTIFVISNATIKPVWALINAVALLRLITDLRQTSVVALLMSHNVWHCLGKLCFTSYLIHYEIIQMLLKSRKDDLPDATWMNVLREFSIATLLTTTVAYFVHILFEAPINKLFTLYFVKPKSEPKMMMRTKPNEEIKSFQSKEEVPINFCKSNQ